MGIQRQKTLNPLVAGSNPAGPNDLQKFCLHGLPTTKQGWMQNVLSQSDTLVQQLYGGKLAPQIRGVYFHHPPAHTAPFASTTALFTSTNNTLEICLARSPEGLCPL